MLPFLIQTDPRRLYRSGISSRRFGLAVPAVPKAAAGREGDDGVNGLFELVGWTEGGPNSKMSQSVTVFGMGGGQDSFSKQLLLR